MVRRGRMHLSAARVVRSYYVTYGGRAVKTRRNRNSRDRVLECRGQLLRSRESDGEVSEPRTSRFRPLHQRQAAWPARLISASKRQPG
jgi:hypothetical protein